MRDWRSGGIGMPFGTFHHFSRQLRQQQAHACCALNTGCPRIGVCFPSFGGFAGARRVRTKSSQCLLIVSSPFSAMYFRSSAESWNRLRNLDFASRANALSIAFMEIHLRPHRIRISGDESRRRRVWRHPSCRILQTDQERLRRVPRLAHDRLRPRTPPDQAARRLSVSSQRLGPCHS